MFNSLATRMEYTNISTKYYSSSLRQVFTVCAAGGGVAAILDFTYLQLITITLTLSCVLTGLCTTLHSFLSYSRQYGSALSLL